MYSSVNYTWFRIPASCLERASKHSLRFNPVLQTAIPSIDTTRVHSSSSQCQWNEPDINTNSLSSCDWRRWKLNRLWRRYLEKEMVAGYGKTDCKVYPLIRYFDLARD